jgi:hypothetical protein
MTVRASAAPEDGARELVEAVLDFDDTLAEAGVPVLAKGLSPAPARRGGRPGEHGAAFWIIDVSSTEQAIDWALRIPPVAGGESIEIRQLRDAADVLEKMLWPAQPQGEAAA